MGIADYSTNPDNNGVINGVQYFPTGMLANALDNACRQLMADLATFYASALLKKMQNGSSIMDLLATPVERGIGYRGLPMRQVTAATTIAASDMGAAIASTGGGLTIPTNATVSIAVGDGSTVFFNRSSATQNITPATGVTLRLCGTTTSGPRQIVAYGYGVLTKMDTDEWWIAGAGVS